MSRSCKRIQTVHLQQLLNIKSYAEDKGVGQKESDALVCSIENKQSNQQRG